MTNEQIPQQRVDEKTAARYVGMSVPFLRLSRMEAARNNRTSGPPYLKIGRAVRYDIRDLDKWLEQHRVQCT